MDIIKKLKKDKKPETVFDTLIKKKSGEEVPVAKPEDMEVTAINPDKVPADVTPIKEKKETGPKREFRTEGMHEFDIESLGVDGIASLKIEYKAKIMTLIDENKFDEAIELLKELKEKTRGT